jgi:hypothetical protein
VKIDPTRVDELVARPSEGLNVEIKTWIKLDEAIGIVKLVRAAFALRNRNGGYLVIGFDDKTLLPDLKNRPSNSRSAFHLDKVQGIISAYASETFEVGVAFGERDGRDYPVIVVPEGVRSPVAAKSDLFSADGKALIKVGDVYFRTLQSNGTASTAVARPQDWPEIVEICFENKEADFGRFLRRQLAGQDLATFAEALRQLGLGEQAATQPTRNDGGSVLKLMTTGLRERSRALLDEGAERYGRALATRKLKPEEKDLVEAGTWSVALVIDPPKTDELPDQKFKSLLGSSNPQYTGWPVWLDSSAFADGSTHPEVTDGAWEALIISADGWSKHLDFERFDPAGKFYLRRNHPDDVSDKIKPHTALEPVIVILRVAEAIAVGLSFAKALGWPSEGTRLGFTFQWTKLKGRELQPWANSSVYFSAFGKASDDEVTTYVEIPVDTPVAAIAPSVEKTTRELFVLFNGYRMPGNTVEHWVQRLIERKL